MFLVLFSFNVYLNVSPFVILFHPRDCFFSVFISSIEDPFPLLLGGEGGIEIEQGWAVDLDA